MVDDLVDSETTDEEQPIQPGSIHDLAGEVNNETSYGLFGTSTASELEARASVHNQATVMSRPMLPSIYNSPFAPQPGETKPTSRPGTANRTTPIHSRNNSQITAPSSQVKRGIVESSQSSMPEPTNPDPPLYGSRYNQTHTEARFPTRTHYTTGGASSIAYGNDTTLEDCHFISPTVDFGYSGSVKGMLNTQTPPNGQGMG